MISRLVVTAAFALIPILLLLRYFRTRDVHPEPRRVLRQTFWLGVLSVIPVILLALPFTFFVPRSSSVTVTALYLAFLTAAIPEELLKLLVVTRFCARRPSFDEPMDGIVYGVTAALGFAALENILYVWDSGWTTALLRAFTSIPIHAATGAMIGYAVARARFGPAKRFTVWKGFLAAVLVHGLYDYGLIAMELYADSAVLSDEAIGDQIYVCFLLVLVILIGSVVWTIRTTRRLRSRQLIAEQMREDSSNPDDG